MEFSEMCRLCRRESNHLESLQGIRNGLPISVLVMMICPVKIIPKDNLPKFICEDCLDVVLSAHKLRDESIESDRYLRQCLEPEQELEEYPVVIKQEDNSFAESLPVFEVSYQNVPQASYKASHQSHYKSVPVTKPKQAFKPRDARKFKSGEDFDYDVDCFKKGTGKSAAWDYFGRLVDGNGDIVQSEMGYFFCKICVTEKKTIKNRYKGDHISTGMIFIHLKVAHGIVKGNSAGSPSTSKTEEDPTFSTTPEVSAGLIFACPEEDCDKVYKLKICLEIHLGLEHTGIADEPAVSMEYQVDLSQSEGNKSKSMAWDYFGFLVDSDDNTVDDQHFYCRLCVGSGTLTKYVRSCSTTTMFHHLRSNHLKNTKKRKRFEGAELAAPIKQDFD